MALQKDIARVEAEIQQVETIRSQCVRVMEDQFNARYWAYGSQRAQYDQCTSIIARQNQEIAEMKDEHSSIEAYMVSLARSVQCSRAQLEAVEKRISGSPAYEQIKHARSDRGSQEAARKNASIEARSTFDALNALREAVESSSFPSREFPAIRTFVQSHLSLGHLGDYQAGWPRSPQKIANVVSTVPPLSAVRGHVERAYQGAARQGARSAGELEDVGRQLRNLHSGGTYMSKDTQDFLGNMQRAQVSLRHRHLTETVLRGFTTQVDKAVLALVETMVHDFLSRLRANIESVDRIKDDLNRRLRGSVFMGEVYQIRQERDQDKETIRYLIDRLDIVAPKATALMQSKPDPNDPDQVKINELIELLTSEGADDAAHRRQLRELADYRNYFRFSIDICDPENAYRKISDLDHRRGKASGGQKYLPFYICLGVAAASAYTNHLGDSKDVPPQSALLLMDEAFEKLDPENIFKIITFYKSLGLQLIMAAPKTHQALYQETFNTLISIVRMGRAVTATPQHFHQAAHDLLNAENPMHWPRSYFEESVRHNYETTAK